MSKVRPTVTIKTSRFAAGRGDDAFSPARVPLPVDWNLSGSAADLLHSARINVDAALEPGRHNIRFTRDFSLDIDILDGTVARAFVGTGFDASANTDGSDDAGHSVVRRIDLSLSRPIVIRNVLAAIRGAQSIIDNQEATLFLEKLIETAAKMATGLEAAVPVAADRIESFKRLLDSANLLVPEVTGMARKGLDRIAAGLVNRVGEPLSVEVSGISYVPRTRGQGANPEILVPRVSGSLAISRTGAKAGFRDVEIPSFFVPRLHASLDGFLYGRPVAGGSIRADMMAVPDLVRDTARLVRSISGRVDAEAVVPEFKVDWKAADRTDTTLEFSTDRESVSAGGSFFVSRMADDAVVELRDLAVRSTGSRRSFVCDSVIVIKSLFLNGFSVPESISGSFRQTNRGSLPGMYARLSGQNPFLKSGNSLDLHVDELKTAGGVEFEFPLGGNPSFRLPDGSASVTGVFSLPDQSFGPAAGADMFGCVHKGRIRCTVSRVGDDVLDVEASGEFPATFRAEKDVRAIPELNLEEGRVFLSAAAMVKADCGARIDLHNPEYDGAALMPRGSISVDIESLRLDSSVRSVASTAPISLRGVVRKGVISRKAEGDVSVDLDWALQSRNIIVVRDGVKSVHELPLRLDKGTVALHISPGGRLNLAGEGRSIVPPEIINALMNPVTQTGTLFEALNDERLVDESLSRLSDIVSIFSSDIGKRFSSAKSWVLDVREMLRQLEVRNPGDVFVEPVTARLISRVLTGDDRAAAELEPLIVAVGSGRGFDPVAARLAILKHRPDIGNNYEVDWILKLISVATAPVGQYGLPVPVKVPPTAEDPCIVPAIAHIPAGAEVYGWFHGPQVAPEHVDRVVELAPLMFIDQLNWIIGRLEKIDADTGRFRPQLSRLKYVISAKRAINATSGGDLVKVNLIPRASVLAGFIGDALGPIPGIDTDESAMPLPCALGPKDIADVLEIGIETAFQGVQAQINNRLVIEHLRNRDGDFMLSVFSELSRDVSMNLAILLMSFFGQDQQRMKVPVDLEALFEEKTGLEVPRFEDFAAGGRRSRESYFGEMHSLAVRILDRTAVYRAAKIKLREAVPENRSRPGAKAPASLVDEAQTAIRAADENPSKSAYAAAFQACAALLDSDPVAFKLPWFKEFWRRNEEALRVAICVRDHQEDCENVREWLAEFDATGTGRAMLKRSGNSPASTRRLAEAFIRTLWYSPEDVERILHDPLTSLLMLEQDGSYDFTVVSGMGVVTDGACGRELEPAFKRLSERRGIDVRRAPTGFVRVLEYNARAIVHTVAGVSGPWGYLGYSQGCANGLRAEHMMMTGTPEYREMVGRLVCRNLLYSAANGSAHASSGTAAFVKVMAEGEKALKHYQSQYSREFVSLARRAGRAVLDSRQATAMIAGSWSMTFERAAELHRNGIFMDTVPTSTVRGVITPERLPDGLKYVFGMHNRLMPGAECDSQVATDDGVGYSTRVVNERTAVLKSCDMGSAPLHMHHWGPIFEEARQMMTPADFEHHRYDNPFDIYVFPWIDVNIRFGRIRRKG